MECTGQGPKTPVEGEIMTFSFGVRWPALAALVFASGLALAAANEEDCSTLRKQLSPKNTTNTNVDEKGNKIATCSTKTRVAGQQGEVNVKVTAVAAKIPAKQAEHEIGDDEPAQDAPQAEDEDAIVADVELEANCLECLEKKRTQSIQVTVLKKNSNNYKEFKAKLDEQVRLKAREMVSRQNKINACLITSEGEPIAESERLECRVGKMSLMTVAQREDTYNDIKEQLEEMVKDPNQRTTAKKLLQKIGEIPGNNTYLKEQTKLMRAFAELHDVGDYIINNPNAENLEQAMMIWNNGRSAFSRMGLNVSRNYSRAVMSAPQMSYLKDDLKGYVKEMEDIVKQNRARFNFETSNTSNYSALDRNYGVAGTSNNRTVYMGSGVLSNGNAASATAITSTMTNVPSLTTQTATRAAAPSSAARRR